MSTVYLAEPGTEPTAYSEEQIQDLWRQGALSSTMLFWREGMPEWRPAQEFINQTASGAEPAGNAGTLATTARAPAAVPGRYLPAATPMRLEKDPRGRTLVLKVLMWISLSLAVISMLISAFYLSQGVAAQEPTEEFTAKDGVYLVVGVFQLLTFFVTTIVFCMWVHLAHRNISALGARCLEFTPGWAVGWYFVPIMNLWKPYQAMKEIWQASHSPRSWGMEPVAAVVSIWWALWIISNFLGQATFRMTMRAETAQANFNSELVSLLTDVTDIALCVVAIRMISAICRSQVRLASA